MTDVHAQMSSFTHVHRSRMAAMRLSVASWDEMLSEALYSLASRGASRQLILATERELAACKSEFDDCHANAEKWVVLHPQHKIVHGFLVMDDSFCLFHKHSVIDTGGLRLLDITRRRNQNDNRASFVEFSDALFETVQNIVQFDPARLLSR